VFVGIVKIAHALVTGSIVIQAQYRKKWHLAVVPDGIKMRFLFIYIYIDTDNQRVIIQVKDVNDEPPYFINRPLPMQAVVQLNAPPNTPVFTLQARDPDTDHNIHYFLVRDRSIFYENLSSLREKKKTNIYSIL